MSMTLTKTIPLGALSVTVRELTVGEIRAWLKRTADGAGDDLVGDTLIAEISLADLMAMTDVKQDDLDNLTPNQVRELFDACREVNKDFFGLRERIEETGRRLLEQLSSDLSETPAP